MIYPEPEKVIIKALTSSKSRKQLWTELPMKLEYNRVDKTSIDESADTF